MAATLAPYSTSPYTVVVPSRLVPAARAEQRATTQVYVRRRLLVSLVLVAVVVALVAGAGNVLANREGAPASASAVRPAISYVVQPGDTLWSIAAAVRGSATPDYVDTLVVVNGGASLQVGQLITLP